VLNYHADNRNEQRIDDRYGEWLNRLNVQLNNGPFTAQIRLDSAVYALKPDPNTLAAADADANPADIQQRARISQISVDEARRAYIAGQTTSYGRDLSSRYINTIYPSKLAVSYTIPGLEVAVGDTYAQLGRGLVLAVRKADELAADTTLRGVKVDFRPDLGSIKLNMTALAGYTNPLRVDEVSGIQLSQDGSALFPLAPRPRATSYVTRPVAMFAPDRILGGKIEQGTKNLLIGVQGAVMTRGTAEFQTGQDVSPSRNAGEISIGSLSLSAPNLGGHGSFFVEGALQQLNKPYTLPDSGDSGVEQRELLRRLSGGKAVYAQLTLYEGPFTLALEGKHYDRFFPLLATVGGSSAAPFQALQYNGVPTTEPITSDTQFEQFNVCVTGGRARLDYRAGDGVLIYATLGRYVTYTERSQTCGQDRQARDDGTLLPPAGKTNDIRNDIIDPYVGFEINLEHGRTHAYGSTGIRIDDAATPTPYDGLVDPTTIYYREHYVRYDAVKKITGPFSIQTAGFHRYRFHPLRSPTPWREGENYISLIYSPTLSGALGVEYSTYGGDLKMFYNGQLQYRITTDTVVRLFVGQTRPALRCVSGVCRQFPAFEGAKLEAVVRF
jgi:hypothetical protein